LSTRRFKTTPQFRRALRKLSAEQKRAAKSAFQIFKQDPFDPRLRAHKIHRLSALTRRTVYAAAIEGDLRVVFYVEGDLVVSFNPKNEVGVGSAPLGCSFPRPRGKRGRHGLDGKLGPGGARHNVLDARRVQRRPRAGALPNSVFQVQGEDLAAVAHAE